MVISNVIGAASYHGSLELLRKLMTKLKELDLNFPAQEKHDVNQKG